MNEIKGNQSIACFRIKLEVSFEVYYFDAHLWAIYYIFSGFQRVLKSMLVLFSADSFPNVCWSFKLAIVL